MSKKELDNLKQRIRKVAVNIKEQEAFTVQVQDYFGEVYQKHQVVNNRNSFRSLRV